VIAALRPAFVLFAFLTVLCGVVYPAVVTGVAGLVFPRQAGGSIVTVDGVAVGSSLVAQPFVDPGYLWPRASAASYDGRASSGSNLGPTNPDLAVAMGERRTALGGAAPPVDAVTASGSGLDPHVSPENAAFQVPRIAAARGIPEAIVISAIAANTEGRTLGIFGEPRVNVLAVNLALGKP
jgi:K+-transporting ATPase ATPase C chain